VLVEQPGSPIDVPFFDGSAEAIGEHRRAQPSAPPAGNPPHVGSIRCLSDQHGGEAWTTIAAKVRVRWRFKSSAAHHG
jgi:hypothetical protein